MTFDIFVAFLEVLSFRASKVTISALRLYGTNNLDEIFEEIRGKHETFHMVIFV